MLRIFRKYYLPGVVSLIGLTIIFFGYEASSYKNERVLEILYTGDRAFYSAHETYLDLKAKNVEFISLSQNQDNMRLIKNTFIRGDQSDFPSHLVFDISDILYEDLVEIINQCNVYNIENILTFRDTLLIGDDFKFNGWFCGPSPNLLHANDLIPNLPKLLEENGKLRMATETEVLSDKASTFFINYLPLILSFFGMIFFYFILPFIQSKISSK